MDDTKVPLTDEMFEESLRKAVEWVQDMVKGNPIKAFIPTLFLECSGSDPDVFPLGTRVAKVEGKEDPTSDRYTVMAMMPDLDMDIRHKALEAFGHKIGSKGVIVWGVYFVAEAWTSHNVDRPALGSKGKYAMPSEDPDRGEVIVVMGMTIDQRCNVGQVHITRNKKEQMVLGETKFLGVTKDDKVKLRNVLCEYFYRGYAVGFLTQNAEYN